MSFVYVSGRNGDPCTVGHYDPSGAWIPESECKDESEGALRCHWLNGGVSTWAQMQTEDAGRSLAELQQELDLASRRYTIPVHDTVHLQRFGLMKIANHSVCALISLTFLQATQLRDLQVKQGWIWQGDLPHMPDSFAVGETLAKTDKLQLVEVD